jgi:TatD DNase family protein
MFSDTHFHLPLVAKWVDGFDPVDFFTSLCSNDCAFAQDIGTSCDDLGGRISFVQNAIKRLPPKLQSQASKMIHFSAGVWPSPEAITARGEQMDVLEKSIQTVLQQKGALLSAIGECGIDHHWNPSGVDGRCESDFDQKMFDGERELFLSQIALAKKMKLPVIVHSRDAFDDTISCIAEGGYDCGIIHCYSYGIEEARQFLDRGWYIAFGGGVTYTKKSKMEAMEALVKYIPSDRILLETDAPYLAPVPFRGQPNTPLLIEHTYRFVAQLRLCTVESLCESVDRNVSSLFKTTYQSKKVSN